jgi:hypothetical protein
MATKVAVELSRFENEDSTITKLDYNAGPENIE